MGTSVQLDDLTLESFSERVRGTVLQPGDEGYTRARTVWNGMVDKCPAAIVRCTGAADVMAMVDFAREHELLLAVKAGGHGVAGHAVCDDGLVIDLSPMNGVRVDPDEQAVRVEGGATWDDVHHEVRAFGLETTGPRDSTVGVAGFTLGGVMSPLTRTHGLAIDNLRAVDVVTADGKLVHASEDEHPELFWALRGGGGNFGIVTSFEFDCYDVATDVLTGRFLYPFEAAPKVLRFYREFMADAPDQLLGGAAVFQVPLGSELPTELHGETVVAISLDYIGSIEAGERTFQPVRDFGEPLLESVTTQSFPPSSVDFLEANRRNYWKNHLFANLPNDAIDTVVEQAGSIPTASTMIVFYRLGGAMNRVDEAATAFAHRDAAYELVIVAQWTDSERDKEVISWAQEFHAEMASYATGGEYVNNQTDDDPERVEAAYGDNYDRLVEVKDDWDPENLFHLNQNIEPTS